MTNTSTDSWPPPPSHSWYLKGETLYQQYQGLDSRQSPNKELPTKILKHDRVKDRQDIAQTLNFDRSHTILLTNKRCAGTQTQFSSFELPPEGEVVVITDTYRQQHPPQRPMVSSCHVQSNPVPIDMDTENVPLNLSVSNNCNNNNNTNNNNNNNNSCLTSSSLISSQQQQLRPSVITSTFTNRYYPNVNSYGQSNSPTRRELTSGMSDPEEHFRRSLGKDYQKFNQQQQQQQQQPSPVESLTKQILEQSVSVGSSDSEPDNLCNRRLILLSTQDNGPSVDDHFAKSLGNSTWSAIKAKRDESTDSVDDHFTKALGDTWHRIKAEKENNCDTLRPASPLQQSSSVSS